MYGSYSKWPCWPGHGQVEDRWWEFRIDLLHGCQGHEYLGNLSLLSYRRWHRAESKAEQPTLPLTLWYRMPAWQVIPQWHTVIPQCQLWPFCRWFPKPWIQWKSWNPQFSTRVAPWYLRPFQLHISKQVSNRNPRITECRWAKKDWYLSLAFRRCFRMQHHW